MKWLKMVVHVMKRKNHQRSRKRRRERGHSCPPLRKGLARAERRRVAKPHTQAVRVSGRRGIILISHAPASAHRPQIPPRPGDQEGPPPMEERRRKPPTPRHRRERGHSCPPPGHGPTREERRRGSRSTGHAIMMRSGLHGGGGRLLRQRRSCSVRTLLLSRFRPLTSCSRCFSASPCRRAQSRCPRSMPRLSREKFSF